MTDVKSKQQDTKQEFDEMSMEDLDAISAGGKIAPTAKKGTASKAKIVGEKFLTWTASKLQELGL